MHYSRALPSSNGEVGHGTRSKAHETREFHFKQVPSCNSTEGTIHAMLTGSGHVFCGVI